MTPKGSHKEARGQRQAEAGTVLVLFALLLVGIFGMLGAVVDGGRLRVTRQQMEACAECAALEGLRFKDIDGDAARRARAITAAQLLFDDDMDPANGDGMGLGAGSLPVVFGAEPLRGDIDVAVAPGARVWKPAEELEANANNSQHGDLVAGQHVAASSPAEDDTFTRADFTPTAPGSAASALSASSAFLVRLRRTSDRLPLDRQVGESSSGPPFEWLWARGAIWHEPTAGQTNASRSDGLSVRAASIAAGASALMVSDAPSQNISVASFALRVDGASAWQATAPGTTLTLDVEPGGLLLVDGVEQGAALASPARQVGAAVTRAAAILTAPTTTTLILPVYGTVGGARTVAGFTLAQASLSGPLLSVTRLQGAVLPAGASRSSPAALNARVALTANAALRALHAAITEPLLAPVLRR